MDTMLVRLKKRDPRRGLVLRRYTYRGIKFLAERGWYRVEKDVADYLRSVRQLAHDPLSPPAFDVCTEGEARALEATESAPEAARASTGEEIKLTPAREASAVTTADLPESEAIKGPGRRGAKRD